MTVALGGTSFPTGDLWQGRPFVRTDIGDGLLCQYDLANTQWLTAYTIPFSFGERDISSTGTFHRIRLPVEDYSIFIVGEIACTTYVDTTNDGSNYWDLDMWLEDELSANSTAELNVNTGTTPDAADTFINHDASPLDTTPTHGNMVKIRANKTSSPGNLQYSIAFRYRLIIT